MSINDDLALVTLMAEANWYQTWTRSTAIYPKGSPYPVYGLSEETGEAVGVLAKAARRGVPPDKEKLTKELGDVLWMVARVADDHDIKMGDLFKMNIEKLEDRKSRNVLEGSGDDR